MKAKKRTMRMRIKVKMMHDKFGMKGELVEIRHAALLTLIEGQFPWFQLEPKGVLGA